MKKNTLLAKHETLPPVYASQKICLIYGNGVTEIIESKNPEKDKRERRAKSYILL